jgi:hypothetical protein
MNSRKGRAYYRFAIPPDDSHRRVVSFYWSSEPRMPIVEFFKNKPSNRGTIVLARNCQKLFRRAASDRDYALRAPLRQLVEWPVQSDRPRSSQSRPLRAILPLWRGPRFARHENRS